MDAGDDRRGKRARRSRREEHLRCPVCSDELNVVIQVAPRRQPHELDHLFTKYFRCGRCDQIQIFDE